MVKLLDVDPADIPVEREGRRGRLSYPIIKMFMESGKKCQKLGDLPRNIISLRTVLSLYIKKHRLPIKIFQSRGEMYLLRLDLTNEGQPIPGWKHPDELEEEAVKAGTQVPETEGDDKLSDLGPSVITADMVTKRFEEERSQTTK